MKLVKKIIVWALIVVLSISIMPIKEATAATAKLNKNKVTLAVGKSVKLKVKNTTGKVKWSSSKKKVATVNQSGKVKAKKVGKTKITAKVGNKKYICKVTVKGAYEKIAEATGYKLYKDTLYAENSQATTKITIPDSGDEFAAIVEILGNDGSNKSTVFISIDADGNTYASVTIYFGDIKVVAAGTEFKAQDYFQGDGFYYSTLNVHKFLEEYDAIELVDSTIEASLSCIDVALLKLGFDVSDIHFTNY